MKTLALANQKGGVGKSAVACQLAYYYAAKGRKILFIDLDHQMNSTRALSRNPKVAKAPFTSSQLMNGEAGPLPESSLVLVPADEALSAFERQPAKHQDYLDNLGAFIAEQNDRFDLCVIDTNPNPDIRYGAALCVSNFIVSPIQLNQEAIDGIRALLHHGRWGFLKLRDRIKTHQLVLIGLLPNLVEPTPFQRANLEVLINSYANLLISTAGVQRYLRIPTRTAIAESQAFGTYLADVPKTSARDAFREMKACFDVIAQRMALEI
jgi:chromosome partitioning protein